MNALKKRIDYLRDHASFDVSGEPNVVVNVMDALRVAVDGLETLSHDGLNVPYKHAAVIRVRDPGHVARTTLTELSRILGVETETHNKSKG